MDRGRHARPWTADVPRARTPAGGARSVATWLPARAYRAALAGRLRGRTGDALFRRTNGLVPDLRGAGGRPRAVRGPVAGVGQRAAATTGPRSTCGARRSGTH